MTDTDSTSSIWPMPKFSFSVDIGDKISLSFAEVSGLNSETQVIEYRKGNSQLFSADKMPGIKKFGNVTMKRGIIANGTSFWDWFNEIKMNTIKRENIIIKLLDESGNPTMTWTLTNAWPVKITRTDLKSDGNEVAIETMELAHEGITNS